MYAAVVNSPKTELTELITDTQTEIAVENAAVLLQGEGIAVIGNGDVAETITYTSIEDDILMGCVRGFQGTPRAWPSGTRVARNYTAYDHDSGMQNILELATDIANLATEVANKTQDASLTQKGITQLYNGVDSASQALAATANSVKFAYDLANSGHVPRGNIPTNWDAATQMGVYVYTNGASTNAPPGITGAQMYGVLVVAVAGAYITQRYTATPTGETWSRSRTESAWNPWSKDITSFGGMMIGPLSVNAGKLGDTVGSSLDTAYFGTAMTNNVSGLFIRQVRTENGTTWEGTATDIRRKTDSTDQAVLRFRGDDVLFLNADGSWTSLRYLRHAAPTIGSGSPEGAVTAPVGRLYLRSDGYAGETLYIKETGTGNTGWRAVK
ncbi:pyocin knob domain-containing protein [Paenibacillus sp. FSL K6-1230]